MAVKFPRQKLLRDRCFDRRHAQMNRKAKNESMLATTKRITVFRKRVLVLLLLLGVAGQIHRAIAQSPGKFIPTDSMTTPRGFHTATLLLDGRVLIAGGIPAGLNFGNNTSMNSAELFDPSTGAFSPTGHMTGGGALHTATLLADGKVLIAWGAFGNNATPSSAELYDSSAGTFTAIGDMAATHSFATLLNNGKVLMSGGATANAELYDPASGIFTVAGDYATPGSLMTVTLLANGKVLLTGCQPSCGSDPYADTWWRSATLSMGPPVLASVKAA